MAVGLAGAGHVDAHDLGPAGGGMDEPEQQAQRRRLAGAVRAEEPEDLPLFDVERQRVERDQIAEALRQSLGPDRRGHSSGEPISHRWTGNSHSTS